MNKNESKYFNTAIKMDEALIKLLEKKDFEFISIKEICDTAGVNRSTFYLHYNHPLDLLKETTKHILDRFLNYFSVDTKSIRFRFDECELNDLLFITPEYITPYLTFVKDNQRLFKTTLKQFGTIGMGGVYDRMFNHIFSPILSRFHFPEKEKSYVMKFYLSGITAVVMEWVDNGCSCRGYLFVYGRAIMSLWTVEDACPYNTFCKRPYEKQPFGERSETK